jgi:hypothetical protein
MYTDSVGSINMLPCLLIKMVIIIRSFSYEISSIVQSYESYVLKYVDDAVFPFFPSGLQIACLRYGSTCIKTKITVVGVELSKSA